MQYNNYHAFNRKISVLYFELFDVFNGNVEFWSKYGYSLAIQLLLYTPEDNGVIRFFF